MPLKNTYIQYNSICNKLGGTGNLNLKIKISAAALTAAILLTSGCNKKPEETTLPSETTAPTVSETVTEPTTESTASEETEQTTYAEYKEYGKGAFPCTVGNVIFKNNVNTDAVIHTYDGVKGLDSGWHGTHWIDVTTWMMELHNYKISEDYLKCESPEYRYHVITCKNDVKIAFEPGKELSKKSYDGFTVTAEVPVTTAKIIVTLPDGFKIVIEDAGSDEEFDISGSGRGWYLTRDQIVVTEYLLECLEKDASKDPLSDIFEHATVIKTNTYTL